MHGFLIKNGTGFDVDIDGIPQDFSFRKLKHQADFQRVK